MEDKKTFQVDERGFYGEFGGAYIPEILYGTVENLKNCYLEILESEEFQKEYIELLRDYVGRPSPLYYARRMSEKYGCRLYLKREDLNHTGAHKINNTIGQILMAKKMGKKRIIAETGAGQHGVATATVCALMDMPCVVYQGALDVERQHTNVERMKMLGAEVRPVTSGNQTLKDATNEAIRDWCCHPQDTFYIIGSTVGPHPYPDMVARLQSIISKEIKEQLQDKIGRDYPDVLMACVGGGSNAAGTIYHYIDDARVRIILAEAGGLGADTGHTAATIHTGRLGILHGSRTLVMQTPDGQVMEAESISAGLDYPGIGPMHANLATRHRATVYSINDDEAVKAAYELTRMEGIIPALESAHAIAALQKATFRHDDIVVLTVSGRGDKDVETYLNNKNMAGEYGNF
ncbi:tryptophan synthase subunit beta [Xylanibacter rodentium]|uniref:Tryptophan synthase beta chain n=2 Tax=Xylanibacter rodentium TaxID=2736289 RepID=A0ABX2AU14_9BACT|nr:tryptophan synthase subunit beta [Xylanibacter rodentium]NPE11600.1 tryptophan synthase subunit beta [Prevotella sp. PJ1A]NPE13141.1 tryptophan synthase subunit beta [Xylanibacter rodentium]NPE38636.1 tryptophan synthase subunit beta [Prevotella sp. PCJ2]